ncbi:MAG: hypothetical protein ACOYNH_01340 [Bacteroidia bacterium]
MKRTFSLFFILLFFTLFILNACKKQPIVPNAIPVSDTSSVPTPSPSPTPSPTDVLVDLSNVPYSKLSEYRFFKGALKDQIPNDNVIPYKPASSLFTDYALKHRFVWLPPRTKATYVADNKIIDLPIGAALIKTFYYNNVEPTGSTQILETRVMIRKSGGWIFAEYVWNEEQTEATLQMNGSYVPIAWSQNGTPKSTNYRIPSEMECLTCHKSNNAAIPIGIKPQNLNTNYQYTSGNINQLQYWISKGILQNNLPVSIQSTIDYHDISQPLKTRLRSYLDINCSHCHQENSHCDYRPLRLAFSETIQSINMGVCVEPQENIDPVLQKIIVPGNFTKSVMHFRLNSTDESTRMPLLGRTLVDDEGVQLLKDYIQSIDNCD